MKVEGAHQTDPTVERTPPKGVDQTTITVCLHCEDTHDDHRCPCPIGEAKFSYIDKSSPEGITTYTVPMVTYCNGTVRLKTD